MHVDWDSESVFGLGLCIPTLDLPPTQTVDSNVALTLTPRMLTIWHVLEAMSRDLHVTTRLTSFRSEDELFYSIISISVSLKRQSMELIIDSSTKVWYHDWRAESLKQKEGKTFPSFGDKLTGFAKK